jgi:transmembrane sensor
MLGLWFSRPWFDPNQHIQNVITDLHSFRQVDLPDGSIVKVNVGSDLHIDFTTRTRNVTLRSGEAYFEVAPDRKRPFVVVADGVAVRAVGTAFNVRVADADIEVLVTEGQVELARPAGPAGPASAPLPVLGAGEHAAVARQFDAVGPARVGKAAPQVVRETLSWHSREMRFLDVPLQEIIAQFNLRNELQLVIVDEALHARKMGGYFALDQVESFVRLLEQEGGVVTERRGKNEILLRAGP